MRDRLRSDLSVDSVLDAIELQDLGLARRLIVEASEASETFESFPLVTLVDALAGLPVEVSLSGWPTLRGPSDWIHSVVLALVSRTEAATRWAGAHLLRASPSGPREARIVHVLQKLLAARRSTAERVVWLDLGRRTVQVDGGAEMSLEGKETQWRLLLAIAQAGMASPRRAVGIADLRIAVWPGERMRPASARNRLHVTLSRLRALGLAEVIESTSKGYTLAHGFRVAMVEPPAKSALRIRVEPVTPEPAVHLRLVAS